jgi:hypothetical protein
VLERAATWATCSAGATWRRYVTTVRRSGAHPLFLAHAFLRTGLAFLHAADSRATGVGAATRAYRTALDPLASRAGVAA